MPVVLASRSRPIAQVIILIKSNIIIYTYVEYTYYVDGIASRLFLKQLVT